MIIETTLVNWASKVRCTLNALIYLIHRNGRGAITNGCTELEIQETMLQTAVYCGIPTGVSMFRVADSVIKQLKEEGILKV